MISYAITTARESGLFEHVVVSTDDMEISEISREWGAETPFIRPAELADDFTPTSPVIAHAILACQSYGWEVDHTCCIYPVNPFIRINDILATFDLLQESGVDYSFPVTEFPSPIQRALRQLGNKTMHPFYPQYEMTRTQDLELAYHDAGQFYWGKTEAWIAGRKIHSGGAGYLIPRWRVVDIDTVEDWKRAELIFKFLQEDEKKCH